MSGLLIAEYRLSQMAAKGLLPKNRSDAALVTTIVSSRLSEKIAAEYGITVFNVLTGFKYIGEKIKQYDDTGKKKFIFGFEESCGYLRGTHARDKDAVVASMLFAEMFCYYAYHGVSVYGKLQEIYAKYGYVFDTSVSTDYKGLNAMKEMNAVVDSMKTAKFWTVGGEDVVSIRDYSSLKRETCDGKTEDIDCSKVNALYYELKDGSFVCLRPSGTEPKLKTYYSVAGKDDIKAKERFLRIKADFESKLR